MFENTSQSNCWSITVWVQSKSPLLNMVTRFNLQVCILVSSEQFYAYEWLTQNQRTYDAHRYASAIKAKNNASHNVTICANISRLLARNVQPYSSQSIWLPSQTHCQLLLSFSFIFSIKSRALSTHDLKDLLYKKLFWTQNALKPFLRALASRTLPENSRIIANPQIFSFEILRPFSRPSGVGKWSPLYVTYL